MASEWRVTVHFSLSLCRSRWMWCCVCVLPGMLPAVCVAVHSEGGGGGGANGNVNRFLLNGAGCLCLFVQGAAIITVPVLIMLAVRGDGGSIALRYVFIPLWFIETYACARCQPCCGMLPQ